MDEDLRVAVGGASRLGRRGFLLAAAGGMLTVAGCGTGRSGGGTTTSPMMSGPIATGPVPTGAIGADVRLRAAPITASLAGREVSTWAYGDTLGGDGLRVKAGERVRVALANALPEETTIHWHGIRIANAMDGLPGMTQDAVKPGARFQYDFVAPDPGTYFFHPHVGTQGDRGLYLPLVVDDPSEPLAYDSELVVVLDDWIDGVDGKTPDSVLAALGPASGSSSSSGMDGMGGMDMGSSTGTSGMNGMGGMSSSSVLGSDGGDVAYPLHLVNGRPPSDPATLTAKAGSRVRIRLVNAGGDTAYRVALAGHTLRVTHADGWPVEPVEVDTLVIGMGERYDVLVDLAAGAWNLYAAAEGKTGSARAILRSTGSTATAPAADARPRELDRRLLDERALVPTASARLASGTAARTVDVALTGQMMSYDWGIGGKRYPATTAIALGRDERVRLRIINNTMMWHPIHLHGHTMALASTGVRRDTVRVRPMETVEVDVVADNPGQWMIHCHNAYHLAVGMATDVTVA
jgi:FtsP/CotA-like multicopper oxidase with cupredoxin domain